MTLKLKGSVGVGGKNNPNDIKVVQKSINDLLALIPPTKALKVDGSLGVKPELSKTIVAIKIFQKKVVFMVKPDGLIDVNGKTHKRINQKLVSTAVVSTSTTLPKSGGRKDLDDKAFAQSAKELGCEVAAIRAVADVESSGGGFFDSGKPKILLEAHIFSRETKHAYDETHKTISSRRWDRSLYSGCEKEYDRLKLAMSLNRKAALKSASWGKFQIMGFNHKAADYSDLEKFITSMFESESKQLGAFVAFLKTNKLDISLKAKNWADFAKGYNGSSYKENNYDTKLKSAYEKHTPKDK